MLRTFTGSLLLLLSCLATAQSTDRVTYADGSTRTVKMRFATDSERARTITFSRNGETLTLGPDRVAGFTEGKSGRTYRSVPVKATELGGSERTTVLRFGEVLADGDLQLYKVYLTPGEYASHAAGSEPYLYVLQHGEDTFVLRLTSIYIYERLHANPSRFRNLLKFLTRDCPVANDLARVATFRDGSILEVIDAYRECSPEQSISLNEKRLQGGVEIDHFGQIFSLDMRDGDFSDQQLSLGVGYQAATRFTERFERFSVMASVHYVYHSFRWRESSDISQSMLRGNLSLGFAPILTDNWMVQATGGLSNYNAVSSGFRSFFSNNYFMISGGVRVSTGNWLFGLHYEHLPGQIARRPGNQLLTTLGYRIRL